MDISFAKPITQQAFSVKAVLASLVICFFCSSCAMIEEFQSSRLALAGSWQLKDSAMGPHLLTFKGDSTYELDYNRDGRKDIWGTFRVHDDKIWLKDNPAGKSADICLDTGVYFYVIEDNNLSFVEYADQCRFRSSALNVLWTKFVND